MTQLVLTLAIYLDHKHYCARRYGSPSMAAQPNPKAGFKKKMSYWVVSRVHWNTYKGGQTGKIAREEQDLVAHLEVALYNARQALCSYACVPSSVKKYLQQTPSYSQ